MRTIEQMVQQEINCCMSSLVSTLAQGDYHRRTGDAGDLFSLCEQAAELACPIADYEEAAIQAGWRLEDGKFVARSEPDAGLVSEVDALQVNAWEMLCERENIEPYDREVFEHWAVSQWFADKLTEQGERVDTDFAGMNVWARTTTGQGIASDGVVERIYSNLMKG